jgi:hypothetical protein
MTLSMRRKSEDEMKSSLSLSLSLSPPHTKYVKQSNNQLTITTTHKMKGKDIVREEKEVGETLKIPCERCVPIHEQVEVEGADKCRLRIEFQELHRILLKECVIKFNDD